MLCPLALSGLAFFHPAFWPLTQLFGGGVWTRILHPLPRRAAGVFFASMFVRFRTLNRMTPADWEWMKRVGEMVPAATIRTCRPRENTTAGQKLLFWGMAVCLL